MGWDAEPWGFPFTRAQWRLTPDEFQDACRRAKALMDQRDRLHSSTIRNQPGDRRDTAPVGPRDPAALESRMILIDSWNEYAEGHYISPTRQYGFGYLDAIRQVFARPSGQHVDAVP